MRNDETQELEIDALLGEYFEALERGEAPQLATLLARYPHLAEKIVRFFQDNEQFRQMTLPLRQTVEMQHSAEQLRTLIGSSRLPSMVRYEIQNEIGAGAMGTVFRALDRERGVMVALKILKNLSPASIIRFKQEFRRLSRIVHPNLVPLFELGCISGHWFFSMGLIEGVDPIEYLQREEGAALLPRLLPVLRQLTQAIQTLHAHSILHRDLKPSNILVTDTGRVVVVDFGLAAEIIRGEVGRWPNVYLAGTPSYVAPEQLAGRQPSTASDWYSFGVILYRLLTGRSPFAEHGDDAILCRHVLPIPHVHTFNQLVPEDLADLCHSLLQTDPGARPTGQEVMRRLGILTSELASPRSPETPFVGRSDEIAFLQNAFHDAKAGGTVMVLIHGPSGIGKTTLVHHFLKASNPNREAVVLSGRCHEREVIPFKAIDPLVDDLTRLLRLFSDEDLRKILPEDFELLVQIFPVLGRINVSRGSNGTPSAEPTVLRHRAFQALRALFGNVADRRPLVLFLDDVQWGDEDSAAMLEAVLRPPQSPALLLIACGRSEEIEAGPLLRRLRELKTQAGYQDDARQLAVGPIRRSDALQLAANLCPSWEPAQAEAIVDEAEGMPFFLVELARSTVSSDGLFHCPILREVLWQRVQSLPPDARALLEIAPVAGRPLARAVALAAAKLTFEQRDMFTLLEASHLTRTSGSLETDCFETYHLRVRQTVEAQLFTEQARCRHASLADALEASGKADVEALWLHFKAAGDGTKASSYAVAAADRASSLLAFDRAASLYQDALNLNPATLGADSALRSKFGDALVKCGRLKAGAEEKARAAELATGHEKRVFQRAAADAMLKAGHYQQGMDLLRPVLLEIGIRLPSSRRGILLSMLWRRFQLRFRGLRHPNPRRRNVSDEDRLILDCLHTVWLLVSVDRFQGVAIASRYLLEALRVGDPWHLGFALALEAIMCCAFKSQRHRVPALLKKAWMLSKNLDDDLPKAYTIGAVGLNHLMSGRFAEALPKFTAAADLMMQRPHGLLMEITLMGSYSLVCLRYLGNIPELGSLRESLLLKTFKDSDTYSYFNLRVGPGNFARLAADDPEGPRRDLAEALAVVPQPEGMQLYLELVATCNLELYCGNAEAAWQLLQDAWPLLEKANFPSVQFAYLELLDLRARSALACVAAGGDPARLLPAVRDIIKKIEKENMPWSNPLARLLRACLARLEKTADCDSHWIAAEEGFLAANMALHAAVVQRMRGQLLNNERLVIDAERWMTSNKIKNPSQMSHLLAPAIVV